VREIQAVDTLRADGSLQLLAEGLNRLEETEREKMPAADLWREVRSIVGGLVPAVHSSSSKPPKPSATSLLTGTITNRDPEWAASMLNRLVRGSGLLLGTRWDGRDGVETFVHQPNERARVAWALWWVFRLGEWKRLRRCDSCGRWFRDSTRPLNQLRCSKRCTRRMTMRAYRMAIRLKKARRAGKAISKKGGRNG
jgi:hypothetical protein